MMMKNIRRRIGEMKLRNKLIISYFVASVIPIMLVSLIIYNISARSIEESSQDFVSMYISQATTNLDNFVERYNQSTRSVLQEKDIMRILTRSEPDTMEQLINNKAIIQRFFGRITTSYSEIDTIMLIGATGRIYHYTRAPDVINSDVLRQQEWYLNARTTEKQLFLTTVHDRSYYGTDKEGVVFTVGRTLWNYNGAYAGTILMDINPNKLIKLSDYFLKIGNRYNIKLVITNAAGGILYHSDAATGKRPWAPLVDTQYEPDSKNKSKIVLSESTNEGKFIISAEIPLSKLLAAIRSIKHVTLWSIAICLLFIFLISIFFSFKITKPIFNLRRSMKQAERGQYSNLIPVPEAHDEIGGLVQSYNKMILRIKELIEDGLMTAMKRKQAQFLALQSQINPHMLYNTLESIRMKAVVKEQDEIAEMIKILARMFRLSMGKDREQNYVRHEIEYTKHYIFLQNIRYDNRFTLDVELSEQVLNTPIIPLVFQPIVENSIKHGFRTYSKELHIRIEETILESGDVRIRIIDNGGALTVDKADEINNLLSKVNIMSFDMASDQERAVESGIGLRNIAERLKLQYGDKYELFIHVVPDESTIVELLIPLQ